MRYKCPTCGKFIKDKFVFGLLHVCLSDEEVVLELAKTQQHYANIRDASKK